MNPQQLINMMSEHQCTQADLARRLGVTEGCITRWKQGIRQISPSYERRITDALENGRLSLYGEDLDVARDMIGLVDDLIKSRIAEKKRGPWERLKAILNPLFEF